MPVTLRGLNELLSELDGFGVNLPKALATAGTFAMSNAIERPAKQMAPVDTGRLRASIHTVSAVSGDFVRIQTGTNVFYGPYVEFGTGKYAKNGGGRQSPWGYNYTGSKGEPGLRFTHGNKPQPFLTTAFRLNSSRIPDLIAVSLRKQIQDARAAGNLAAVAMSQGMQGI